MAQGALKLAANGSVNQQGANGSGLSYASDDDTGCCCGCSASLVLELADVVTFPDYTNASDVLEGGACQHNPQSWKTTGTFSGGPYAMGPITDPSRLVNSGVCNYCAIIEGELSVATYNSTDLVDLRCTRTTFIAIAQIGPRGIITDSFYLAPDEVEVTIYTLAAFC